MTHVDVDGEQAVLLVAADDDPRLAVGLHLHGLAKAPAALEVARDDVTVRARGKAGLGERQTEK